MKCIRCGNEFRSEANHSYAKFCSSKCRVKAYKKQSLIPTFDKPFMAWDGEGIKTRYILLANSGGLNMTHGKQKGLKTLEIFERMVNADKNYNHVWYGFGYDVTMTLFASMPFEIQAKLHRNKSVIWKKYWIHYLPRKQLLVKHLPSGKSFNSYDVIGFFQCSFVDALKEWFPGETFDIIEKGKAAREDFSKWPLQRIIDYNAKECELLAEMMNRFRDALREANLEVTRFDGAGAIASSWMKREAVKQYYGEWPESMELPIRHSYFGGRNDAAAIGFSKCYGYDINSAYPGAMCNVPDLSRITWRHYNKNRTPSIPFALCHVEWDLPESCLTYWNPFPWRSPRVSIHYPSKGEGWYYAVEVKEALARFERYSDYFRIKETWEPTGQILFPLSEAIKRDYHKRAEYKRLGRPANVPLKLGLNSLYGKTMQRLGFGNRPPAFRNYLWGGFITAQTRAWCSEVIRTVGDRNVLACATDGIFTTKPLPQSMLSESEIGKWKHEQDISSIAICGGGLYETYRDKKGTVTLKNKRRGFGSSHIPFRTVLETWDTGFIYRTTLRRFIGIGLASCTNVYRDKLATFQDIVKTINDPRMTGTEKRMPNPQHFQMTWLEPAEIPFGCEIMSHPYYPVEGNSPEMLEMETIE